VSDRPVTKILKTLVPSDNGTVHICDTIEHEGKLWLVPQWLDKQAEGLSRPACIIRMDNLAQTGPQQATSPHFALKDYMPKTVLDGTASPEIAQKYEIVDMPLLVVRTGGGFH
jgi:hypothetical protein